MELHRTERITNQSGHLVEVQYIGIAAHEGAMRNAVLNLKYHGKRTNARQLALVVIDALRDLHIATEGCVVTWAPTTARRVRQRGFDQSELIARHVGAFLKLPVRQLLRRRTTRAQTGHSRFERLRGVSFVGKRVRGASVLLIDDVVTTGATFRAAAQELVHCGSSKVICVAPSRTMEKISTTYLGEVNGYEFSK